MQDIDGTLVHYPSGDAATPGETFADASGEIVGESVHPGFHLYMDKVLCTSASTL